MELTIRTPGLVIVEHEFEVPLDHDDPTGPKITVFAREVAEPQGRDRPILVFLQGGPGIEATRPTRFPAASGWMERALQDHRVLLLDQRGTGRSTPVGSLPGMSPPEQYRYLTHFRADSIVRDAEWIRAELGVEQWSVLGQSFGGFCTLAYLSRAPESLTAAYFTGGLPPLGRHPDEIYTETFGILLERNRRYYERYPQDRPRVRRLQERLAGEDFRLPSGDRLTPHRLQQSGNLLGAGNGAELLHYLLELDPDAPAFRHDVEGVLTFSRNPLYAVIHEACYADGHATNWSAARVMPEEYRTDPTLFTGEHVFPWMLSEFGALAPLGEAAELLAAHEWPALYDPARLAENDVPAAAAVYAEDAYVVSGFSMETAHAVRGLRPWLTNEYEHNGLRADGGRILDRLMDLAHGRA